MTTRTRDLTRAYIHDFTTREDKWLALVKEKGLELPERLKHWRQWIGDSQIYLSELRTFAETGKPTPAALVKGFGKALTKAGYIH